MRSFLIERDPEPYNPWSMIAHLRGRLLSKSASKAIVECAGVGYEIAISVESYTALPERGSEVALHIHTHVREDQIALFGFIETAEKAVFEKLLTISGIGPKLALTILSGISTDRLVSAIRGGDHASLTRIPGVGKKTAERVVLELRDKLEGLAGSSAESTTGAGAPLGVVAEDVLSALVNLGYARPAAQKAVEAVAAQSSTHFEELFRAAMQAIR